MKFHMGDCCLCTVCTFRLGLCPRYTLRESPTLRPEFYVVVWPQNLCQEADISTWGRIGHFYIGLTKIRSAIDISTIICYNSPQLRYPRVALKPNTSH